MIPASLDPAWLRMKLTSSNVPGHVHDGYVNYILEGIRPGGFLSAVLSNDLREACLRADSKNVDRIWQHVFFLVNFAPAGCWGSPERVTAWVESFHQKESA